MSINDIKNIDADIKAIAAASIQYGNQVYIHTSDKIASAYISDGKYFVYIWKDWIGDTLISTVHKPNTKSGAGHVVYHGANITLDEIREALRASKENIDNGTEQSPPLNSGYAGGLFGILDYYEITK